MPKEQKKGTKQGSKAGKRERVVVVTGDVTMDWNIGLSGSANPHEAVWSGGGEVRTHGQRGGAMLLAELIQEVARGLSEPGGPVFVACPRLTSSETIQSNDGRYHHSYAIWQTFNLPRSASDNEPKKAWRVQHFLGSSRATMMETDQPGESIVDVPAMTELVVLDDAGLGFRESKNLWPKAINSQSPPWVLVKMARPVAKGPLWDELHKRLPHRLIVVMNVDDLRRTEVQLSRGLSWERLAEDLAWELWYNPEIRSLSECTHIVISFPAAGAFLFSKDLGHEKQSEGVKRGLCRLVFDPQTMESEWVRHYSGRMVGWTTCLTVGLARELIRKPQTPDLVHGIQRGIAAMRALHIQGYGVAGANPKSLELLFPTSMIAAELARDEEPLACADVPSPMALGQNDHGSSRPWTILGDRYLADINKVAEEIILKGAEKALTDVPIGRFGGLVTVDRQEIEAFSSIRALILKYHQDQTPKPLSIAVFGPPGSGKSFGVTEVAKSLPGIGIKDASFNFSQFDGPADLIDALHQVRDIGLTGSLPLVFWDEFDCRLDSQPLGWLPYFLVPMQDGKFQHGQITHPIGRAIFVFAGGTKAKMEDFGKDLIEDDLRNSKVPDFLSRLKGYVNILGPDRFADARGDDPHFIIRRAVLLRSVLKRQAPELT